MARFHFNPGTGDVGSCTAAVGNCPFGEPGLENHFDSLREATVASEAHSEKIYGSFRKVKTLEEFEAEARGETVPAPRVPEASYVPMVPPHQPHAASLVARYQVPLADAREFGQTLVAKPGLTQAEAKKALYDFTVAKVNKASATIKEIDNTLGSSHFFKEPIYSNPKLGDYTQTSVVSGNREFITRIYGNGKARLEVFDLETYENEAIHLNGSNYDPEIAGWIEHFKVYQDTLYVKLLWEREMEAKKNLARSLVHENR